MSDFFRPMMTASDHAPSHRLSRQFPKQLRIRRALGTKPAGETKLQFGRGVVAAENLL
jgi:hypothetical protein